MDWINKAADALKKADALLIGASNGLSIAEGYNIFADNEMFRRQFGQFQSRFGISSVLDGIFFNYPTLADREEFFNALIRQWLDGYTPSGVMLDLLKIAGAKDYFIITSNGDTHLELSGFASEKVFEIEGTFISMAKNLTPKNKTQQLEEFLARNFSRNLVFLEIGIGSRNQLIKAPMLRLAAQAPNSQYVIFNLPQEIIVTEALRNRTIPLAGDLASTLAELARNF